MLQGGSASSEQLEELEGEESGSIVLGDCVRSRRIEGHLRVGYASTDCRWGTRGCPSCGNTCTLAHKVDSLILVHIYPTIVKTQ